MRAAAFSSAALAALFIAGQAVPAAAQEAPVAEPLTVDAILDGLVVIPVIKPGPVLMSDGELAEQRGGFFSKEWAAGINFGAILTTYIDGKIAMATQLTLGSKGAEKTVSTSGSTRSTSSSTSSSAAAPPNTPTLTATDAGNSIGGQQEAAPAPSGTIAEQAAAAGITLNNELSSWNGVVVPGEGGGTAVLQSAEASRIAQVVLNTANGVNIQQNTNVTVDIPGFAALQQGFINDMLKSNIQDSVSSALGAALRR